MIQWEDVDVLVRRPAEGGPWEAVALQMFVVTYGDTLTEAIANLKDAVVSIIEWDVEAGLNPFHRDKAPEELFDAFHRVKGNGHKVPTSVVDRAIENGGLRRPVPLVFVTTMQAWAVVPGERELPMVGQDLEPGGASESVAVWQEAA